MNVFEAPSQKEPQFSKVAFLNKLLRNGEVISARPRGVLLPRWEACKQIIQNFNDKASTSIMPCNSLSI